MGKSTNSLPNQLIKVGWLIILFSIAIITIILFTVKYADIIPASVTLTTANPSLPLIAQVNGKVKQILVKDHQQVGEGEILAILDSPVSYVEVQKVKAFLDGAKEKQVHEKIEIIDLSDIDQNITALGDLQASFTQLVQSIQDYNYFLRDNGNEGKVRSYESQIKQIRGLVSNLNKQLSIIEDELAVKENDYLRNQSLNEKGVVSDVLFEASEEAFLQKKRQRESINEKIINSSITIEQINFQIINLQQIIREQGAKLALNVYSQIKNIEAAIAVWEKRYLVTAPIAGQVSFSKIWNKEQYVSINEEMFTVVPTQSEDQIIARCLLPIRSSGKIGSENVVNIKLDGFPYKEYGTIPAIISSISLTPNAEKKYYAELSFPEGLSSSYGKVIPFRPNMTGSAEIVLAKRTLADRILDELYNAADQL